jgi:hypothetical protein
MMWTAFGGLAFILLIVLWMRSFQYDKAAGLHGEKIQHVNSHKRLLTAWSKLGAVHFCVTRPPSAGDDWNSHFAASQILGFGSFNGADSTALRIPYWSAIVAACGLTVFPWTRFFSLRFTLRTLLIATTLVAAMLGLIVYYARN